MADLPVPRDFKDKQVARKYYQMMINEHHSRINKLRQDIKDLQNVQLLKLEGCILECENSVKELENKLKNVDSIVTESNKEG